MFNKKLAQDAHKLARQLKLQYSEIDYNFQFGINVKFLATKVDTIEKEIKEVSTEHNTTINKNIKYCNLHVCSPDRETEKAIQVEGKWFPKSTLLYVYNNTKNKPVYTIYVPSYQYIGYSDLAFTSCLTYAEIEKKIDSDPTFQFTLDGAKGKIITIEDKWTTTGIKKVLKKKNNKVVDMEDVYLHITVNMETYGITFLEAINKLNKEWFKYIY